MRSLRVVGAVSLAFAIVLNAVACESDKSSPADTDASVSPGVFDAAPPIDATPQDATVKDAGVDAADAADAADAGPSCVAVIDGGPDAGPCALPVFSTGVNAKGVAAAGGSIDAHYTMIQSAEATLPGPNAIVVSQIAAGFWVGPSTTSSWIAPSADQSYPGPPVPCNGAGTYAYRTTFNLTGYDPTTARIVGAWAADNSGTAVRLNGVSLGITAAGYNPMTPFTIVSGFVAGMNTLEFEILDSGCPNGLRVELSGTASLQR
jgi:hypothetical protein